MLPFQGRRFIHSFVCTPESPVKEFFHETRKIYGHRPHSPTWKEGLHTMGCCPVPQGDRLRHCHYYPSVKKHVTFQLGLGTAPVARVCCSNPLRFITSTPVTTTHVTQGTDLQVTLRYGRGVGFVGGGSSTNKTQKPEYGDRIIIYYATVTYQAY